MRSPHQKCNIFWCLPGSHKWQNLKTASGKTAVMDKIKIWTLYGQSTEEEDEKKNKKKQRAEHFNPHLHNLSSTPVRWCNICIKFTVIILFTSPCMLHPRWTSTKPQLSKHTSVLPEWMALSTFSSDWSSAWHTKFDHKAQLWWAQHWPANTRKLDKESEDGKGNFIICLFKCYYFLSSVKHKRRHSA